ncbi:cellulose binding domain-containing protein [Nonomuraea gerenzanensis]|uniref:Endoglucanase E-4 (Endo-1,4-beta-glucanase E-4) (Cellulase E-4) (Cellulase E4) n=1 Tax=Nonomuraea gerenzanensis TaxID=93944 RepID=A0A1M4DVG1_9ACTN|nr:cellulose binding domain-containing protein [Nonomuraea gerenzanensis]UBU12891.1 cellulose binding domain-containing protein [Nonomuraea gerenzanensis]SBO90547.1 Endoglucanase E-4 precursor (Endo-1,4-beta-glucanase E-4) (Cellulase E-4) (Cellulase E4) [Nonomuraea gerenzanensis]
MPRISLRVASAVLLTLTALNAPAAHADETDAVQVTVNARAALATVPETGLGTNHAIWDSNLGTNETADLLKDAGMKVLRYPGGSYSDIYHWADHTAPGGYVAPNTDFDTFMRGVRRTGAQPMVTANYGTGTAEEAAAWVRHANLTKGYGVKYWEIGNENYGNGHYGAAWEADDHADKSPNEYARHVVAYADAMKAVDPTIKIGAVLTTPANWPDAIVAEGDSGSWNKVVLSTAGSKIDFVILHWYPGALDKTGHVPDMIQLTREQIAKYAGPGSERIGIAMTEFNTGSNSNGTNTQPGALAAADAYATLLANGVFTVDWWNVHNGIGTVTEVEGHTDYGDFGLLSSGTCTSDGSVCEPALNTPFAPYYALQMTSRFARPGDRFLRAATDQAEVTAHAARRPNGDLAVMLINTSSGTSYPVELDYSGFTPAAGAPTVLTHTNGATSITTAATGTATTQTLPPLSLTTVILKPSAVQPGRPGTPGQPAVAAVTDQTATITWPAAKPGARPIAKYEVHRQHGAVSEQLGETGGTTLTVRNLKPGTRYTVNVIARDAGGATSDPSPPLTFTTGTPATSSCSVKLTVQTDWASGYVGAIDITNHGAPLNGWTLSFTWPRAWQSFGSGWSAVWTQTGSNVKAVNEPANPSLATGATTTIGYVGNYSGPNVLPSVFTLNGTVCTTTQ